MPHEQELIKNGQPRLEAGAKILLKEIKAQGSIRRNTVYIGGVGLRAL